MVEQETIKRWRNIASRRTEKESSHPEETATEDTGFTVFEVPSPSSTIKLTEAEAIEDRQPANSQQDQSSESRVLPCDLNIPIEEDLKRRFGSHIRSALGPGTVIEGTFRFDSPVCIDGTLTGEVCSTSALIVGDQATVNAQVKVGSLIVMGQVYGEIEANELIEIRAGGQLRGDIVTRRLVMEEGGWFNGCCNTLD